MIMGWDENGTEFDINIVDGMNQHGLVTGVSGSGKSIFLNKYMASLSKEHHQYIYFFDFSDSFDENQLDRDTIPVKYINPRYDALHLNIMEPRLILNQNGNLNIVENDNDIAVRLCEILASAFKLSMNQKGFLYNLILRLLEKGCRNFNNIYQELETVIAVGEKTHETQCANALAYKFARLFQSVNIISTGNDSFWDSSNIGSQLVVLKLSSFSSDVQQAIVNILLADLIMHVKGQMSSNTGHIKVILDEFQKFKIEPENPIGILLAEGRKYSVGLWLATQYLTGRFDKEVLGLLEQAAHRMIFQPNETDIPYLLKLIGTDKDFWKEKLKGLRRGHAVILCNYCDRDRIPVIIKTK